MRPSRRRHNCCCFSTYMKAKNYLFTVLLCLLTTCTTLTFLNANSESVDVKVQEPLPTLIESLQNGESYSIEITSIGCFNGTRQTVVVSREADVLQVDFQDISKILSEADIEAFRTFEIQLRALKMGGCTTVDTYVLRFRNEEFRTSDGTCNWNGDKKLLQAISQ